MQAPDPSGSCGAAPTKLLMRIQHSTTLSLRNDTLDSIRRFARAYRPHIQGDAHLSGATMTASDGMSMPRFGLYYIANNPYKKKC